MSQKTPISRGLPLFTDAMVRKHIQRLGMCLPAVVKAVNGSIVTVSFQVQGVQLPQVTMPVFGPEYIRYPIQVGDKGMCVSADTYLGGMSGLGTGTADLSRRGNLSMLVFLPIGNKNWTATDDANAVVIYGPDGVILRDTGKKTVVTLTPDGVDINAQHNVTVEADTKVEATVGSNSVLLNTTEVQITVGSTQITANATSIALTAGGTTLTIDASGVHTLADIAAADIVLTGAVTAATASIGGKAFATHKHSGVTTGGGNTGNPI